MLESAAKFRLRALEALLKVSESSEMVCAADFSLFFYGKSSKMV